MFLLEFIVSELKTITERAEMNKRKSLLLEMMWVFLSRDLTATARVNIVKAEANPMRKIITKCLISMSTIKLSIGQ